MIGLLLLIVAALAYGLDAPWWLRGLVITPALVLGAGLGWARRLSRPEDTGLQRILDASWLGLAATWLDVALVREAGQRGAPAGWGLLGMAALWGISGWALSRKVGLPKQSGAPVRLGLSLLLLAVLGVATQRQDDIGRPLDAYWYATGAESPEQEPLDLRPGRGWASVEPQGWPEAGALKLVPDGQAATLASLEGAQGRLTLAVRGPIGSHVAVGDQRAVVSRAMVEAPEEGPVRRYLERGTAGLVLQVDLAPGEELPLEMSGEALYLLPGSEAVWAVHAEGDLRYTHYYQLLNQVENQVWAEELLESRWFTWNQPPGWSPILASTVLLVGDDLPAANLLFLWVLLLIGASSLRLCSLIAPGAPLMAAAVPPALVAAHGLLMLEPASTNFPDSLYAASALAVALSLARRSPTGFGLAGAAAQALRWPGTVLSLILLAGAALFEGLRPGPYLPRLLALVGLGGLIAGLAVAFGHADDLAFVLYFETFPEHWHGDYAPGSLLPRIPAFYGRWMAYTGGGIGIAALCLGLGAAGPARDRGRALLLAALTYSALLCTVDHFPTHYFLPLLALTGPAVVAASASVKAPWADLAIAAVLAGVGLLLYGGRTW